MKKHYIAILLMMVIVPLAGELKFYPFEGEFHSFRVSFGSPAFLFFLLWLRSTSFMLPGLLAGLSVLVFRLLLDWSTGDSSWTSSFLLHMPAFLYYVIYAGIFYLAKANDLYSSPLRIGLLSILAEITASMIELLLPLTYSSAAFILTFSILSKLLIAAVIRSFFVLSFFFITNLRHAEFAAEQQKEQNKHILLLISSLYEEAIQLTKSLQNAENITRDCYKLYKDVNDGHFLLTKNELAQNILEIAGQVHEIKKDNQRIYASLTQLISDGELHDYMTASELGEIIVQSHQKYARSLGKNIIFDLQVETTLPPLHVYTVLSLVNNLASNAVESIQASGSIRILFYRKEQFIVFQVADNGPGIPIKKRTLIFKPGYTTKFDVSGNPSTGMGLPYSKDLANSLKGSLTLEENSPGNETIFTITLPPQHLVREG
ncbi:sensor histidine kinase [Pelosinus propionicus]|uniref:histidine kinase n=1 Tax=Pelosinus propionicus DSM 13327 TaxID=1123291 RepID=A0A1I4IA23_9FIRM|nr:sensor histidine kinase [Pelosinus propionicus]SFL51124.1 two-component system, sensor histidine kinase YcbA [Pelosinus propionicus DSM 13327]